jgi:hypothetical protein
LYEMCERLVNANMARTVQQRQKNAYVWEFG